MKITYLSHSTFLVEEGKFKAIIDPFITDNPKCKLYISDLKDITHIFITHGHGDHIGDTIEISKKFKPMIICNFEIGHYLSNKGLENIHTMHIGGRVRLDFGVVKMTPALHGSSIFEGEDIIYAGNPSGYLIDINGKKIYHAGDTGLTKDMEIVKDENIDIALLPIGGNFTMDIDDAVKAVDYINPKITIPMHYDTFEAIEADPLEFKKKVRVGEVKVLKFNESIEI